MGIKIMFYLHPGDPCDPAWPGPASFKELCVARDKMTHKLCRLME
ncbi:hypothetical protein Pcinc_026793 [Petrolisthes cinctipes]|uniref:Uncharacterized protein n=1 Tax=Petrolisthes cinctipes TaxID=88211 RepID=A0AAE1F6Q6_PETCI|nr:hypothetical protein Pcinc_026793 [Petrolisthes cinctipes]